MDVKGGFWTLLLTMTCVISYSDFKDNLGMFYELVTPFVFNFLTAKKNGYFRDEIIPVEVKEKRQVKIVDTDEHPRADISVEAMKNLSPVFKKNGTVSAGNASVRTLKSITNLICIFKLFWFIWFSFIPLRKRYLHYNNFSVVALF